MNIGVYILFQIEDKSFDQEHCQVQLEEYRGTWKITIHAVAVCISEVVMKTVVARGPG